MASDAGKAQRLVGTVLDVTAAKQAAEVHGMVDFNATLNNGRSLLSLNQYFGIFLMRRDSKPSLLYRYFFFSWLFRSVDCGSWLERSAAWRHNQAQAHWLLTYLKRWLVLDLLALSVGALSSQLFQGHWICICLLYTSPSPRDATLSRMPSSA